MDKECQDREESRLEPLHRELSRSEDRSMEAEYRDESYHLKSGHIRAGGGWMIRRKSIERGD